MPMNTWLYMIENIALDLVRGYVKVVVIYVYVLLMGFGIG